MKVQASFGGLLIIMGIAWPALATERAVADQCAPSGELKFLCGMEKPEDLAVLPGGRWIVASGNAPGSGLHLIDGKTKKWERWIARVAQQPRAPFDKCPSQLLPNELQVVGISVRDRGQGQATLYGVNRRGSVAGGRNSIEVFDIAMSGAKPTLTWAGCIPMPGKLVANSVASAPDGSIFATVMLHPENSMSDLWKGLPTGAVYKWTPQSGVFKRMAGTELTGNNGIEVSRNGDAIYVNSLSIVTKFTNTNPARRLTSVKIKGGFADNIHWVNERLVIAGPRTDQCQPSAGGEPCLEGYFVSSVDPQTLALTTVARGLANPAFSGASAALPVGKTLWLGSYSANKVAYRSLW